MPTASIDKPSPISTLSPRSPLRVMFVNTSLEVGGAETLLVNLVGRLNRLLTRLTDMFVAVAAPHGQYLVEREGFPAAKVCVISNGVDVDRFRPRPADPELRRQLGLPDGAPLAGILAALRPEKNHP